MSAPQGYPHNDSKTPRILRLLCSLQFKATLLVVALTLCVTGVVTGYFLQSSIKLSRKEHKQQLVQAAAMLSTAVSAAIESETVDSVHHMIVDLVQDGPLDFVRITDKYGKLLSQSAKPAFEVHLADLREQPHRAGKSPGVAELVYAQSGNASHLDVLYPISAKTYVRIEENQDRLLGYVRAGMAVSHWHQTMASKLDLVIGVGIIAGTLAVFLGFMLIRRIVSPLDSLATKMIRFSKGDLDVRSEVRRRDEIGQLSWAFDRMADEHQQAMQRLVSLNAELEERVAERTRQLEELASRDPLTGIYNRRYFNDMVEHHFAQARRYGHDCACLMVDLDDFKRVNDTYGHQAGDKLLKIVADTILETLRTSDVCARYGGDEFVALLPQTDVSQATVLGQRVLEAVEDAIKTEQPEVTSTLSVGIASLATVEASDAEAVLRAADQAMYRAKYEGKGRIVTTESPLTEQTS